MDKDIIAKNFSRCACGYDKYANIQNMAASKLLKLLPKAKIANILELGCGTGNYTALLRDSFRSSRITALDISEGMIRLAGEKLIPSGVEFIVDDAEHFRSDEKFGLITSNAAFQWFQDLDSVLAKYSDMLEAGGRLAFSAFGPGTFMELNAAMEGDSPTASVGFLDRETLTDALKKYFDEVHVETFVIKEAYPSLAELLRKIKFTGVRGDGNGVFQRKKIEERYKKIFGSIEATYEIYLCSGDRY